MWFTDSLNTCCFLWETFLPSEHAYKNCKLSSSFLQYSSGRVCKRKSLQFHKIHDKATINREKMSPVSILYMDTASHLNVFSFLQEIVQLMRLGNARNISCVVGGCVK